jgi:hypothetical protein
MSIAQNKVRPSRAIEMIPFLIEWYRPCLHSNGPERVWGGSLIEKKTAIVSELKIA